MTSRATQPQAAGGGPRRGPARSRPPRELPILPLAIGGIFLVVFIALIAWYRLISGTPGAAQEVGPTLNNIQCQTGEQLAAHYHAHLEILNEDQPVTIPANTGIRSSQGCIYWLHTHDASGVIHIEAPSSHASRQFTLGDFFAVWGQPLSNGRVAKISVGSGNQLRMWVNGTPYTGDPSKIVLKSHEQVVIEIGPPYRTPPPTFHWPAGL